MAHTGEKETIQAVDFSAGLVATLSAVGQEPSSMTSALQRKGS